MTTRIARTTTRAAGLLLAAALAPASASAEELNGSITAYGWLPWMDLKATPDSGAGSLSAEISAGDVLDALKFTFMAAGEIHYGRVGILQDFIYTHLGQDGRLAGPFASKVEVDVEMVMSTTALGYKVYEKDGVLIEPFAGVRYLNTTTDVTIKPGGPIAMSRSTDTTVDWWDPIIGVRGRVPLTEKLSAGGFVDIGGFGAGSDFTWEVFVGLDYALSDRFSTFAGFRYISIDYDTGTADLDMDMYGPAVGLTMRF